MTSRVDEEHATVDSGIRDMSITHRSELFAQIRRVLVLDLDHD